MAWKDVVCEYCGLRYSRYRAPGQPLFPAAKVEMFLRSVAAQAEGDYTVQSRRGQVLMFMHEYKRASWENEHVHWCELEAASKSVGDVPLEEAPF